MRLARTLLLALVTAYAVAGALASYRAYVPVGRVRLVVPDGALRSGARVRVETVTSGRGPVSIRLDLVQGSRQESLAVDRIPSRRWAYWDPRRVYHSTDVLVPDAALERFEPGPVTLRATVTGAPAWLRQPPAVIAEQSALLQARSAGSRGGT